MKLNLMSYNIWPNKLKNITINGGIINTINAYSYVIAKNDQLFNNALKSSDILLPDGFPLVFAAKLLKKQKTKKIAGADLFFHFLNLLNQNNNKCFFLGATEKTLTIIKKKLASQYTNIKVGYYSPPFKSKFSETDNKQIYKQINNFAPDVLFVGMTAPKQEKWVYENKAKLQVKTICCIGAVFNFYAGTVKRAPEWMIKFSLEWFYRLLKEPKRMWKRYLIYSPIFFWDLFLYMVRIKK